VAMELRLVARRLAAGSGATRMPAEPRARPTLPTFPTPGPTAAAPGDTGPAFAPPPIVPQAEPSAAPPLPGAPWHEDSGVRARADVPAEAEPAQAGPGPAQKPRRNLLFQSSVRKDRERPQRPGDPASADFRAQPPAAPPVAEAGETRPANFEDAWPRP